MPKRSYFWDNYKGILIFLVVLGHFIYTYALKEVNPFVSNLFFFIYMFHMPAFIFCSGYLSKSERSRSKQALIQLFLYYVIFNTAMMLFLYFNRGKQISVLIPYNSYWYLLSLIVWRFVIGDLSKVKGIIPISLAVTLLLGYNSEFSNLLSIRRTFAFFIFFLLGYLMDREKFEKFIDNRNYKIVIFGILASIASVFAIFMYLKNVNINLSMVLMSAYKEPSEIFVRIMIIIISLAMIVFMMMVLPNSKIPFLTNLGKNSLLVYLIHRFFTYPFNDVFHYKNYSEVYFIYTIIISIVVCIIFSNEKLNTFVSQKIALLSKHLVDENSKVGNLLKTSLLFLFVLLLLFKAF